MVDHSNGSNERERASAKRYMHARRFNDDRGDTNLDYTYIRVSLFFYNRLD